MTQLWTRRTAWRVTITLLVLLVLAGASLVVHARFLAPMTLARSINWQHPVQVPGPGMALSGIGSPATGDLVTPAHGATNALENFSSGCYEGWAYRVGVGGTYTWTTKGATLMAWTQYLWCARWQGDQVGLNFAYMRTIVVGDACRQVSFGSDPSWGFLGAMMYAPNHTYINDGEPAVTYTMCGAGSYAWDYSQTAPGNGVYSVGGVSFDAAAHTRTFVWSPCCY